jgi:hypothetical protein
MTKEAGERSFDELARGLASGTLSRRKALRLMGGVLVGSALAFIPGTAGAKPKPAGKKCKHDHQCASERCVNDVCDGNPCSVGFLVTPVGGGAPFCACSVGCQLSCTDCVEGTICTTGGGCDPARFPVTCAVACP